MKVILAIAAALVLAAIGLVVLVLYGIVRCAEAQDESRDDSCIESPQGFPDKSSVEESE